MYVLAIPHIHNIKAAFMLCHWHISPSLPVFRPQTSLLNYQFELDEFLDAV